MKTVSTIGAIGAALALVLSGCSSSSNPASSGSGGFNGTTSGNDQTNAGQTGGGLWGSGVADMHGRLPGFGLPFPTGIPQGCDYDAASHIFTCPPDTVDGGLAITRSYSFADSAGNPQSAYDSTATASIHFLMHEGGTLHRGGMTRTVDDTRDLTESGLEGAETTHIWNGADNGSIVMGGTRCDGAADSASTRADSSATTIVETIQAVVLPFPMTRVSWPLSGTITRDVTMLFITGPHAGQSKESTSSITFNGTEFVPMTIDGHTVTVDLGNGRPGRHEGGEDHGPRHSPHGRGRGR